MNDLRILSALVCALWTATALAAPENQGSAETPAAAVLAAVSGEVWVERASEKAPLHGTLGMRLVHGDMVRAAAGASATLYLPGGGIVRVPAGSRLEIPRAPADRYAGMQPEARMSAGSLERLEAGLWVLNDPKGSILVSSLRSGGDPSWEAATASVLPLSPRYETLVVESLAFRWKGGPETARVAIARGEDLVWRSAPVSGGKLAVGEGLPQIEPEKTHWWWLEAAGDGGALTERVPFRIARQDLREQSASFEREMQALAETQDGTAAADLLRCAYYLEAGSWTRLLDAASRLARLHPDSDVAKRALDAARREMRLDEEALKAW